MYRVLDILTLDEVAECREMAANATFVDGKITNPHNSAKQNEQLHEQAAYQRSAKLVADALLRSEEFHEFAFQGKVSAFETGSGCGDVDQRCGMRSRNCGKNSGERSRFSRS